MKNIDKIIGQLQINREISIDDSFNLAQSCSLSLRNSDNENEARVIIINVLDKWKNIPIETHEMWTDLVEAAGFYPYLEKEKKNLVFKNFSGQLRKEFHKAEKLNGKYFHQEQKYLVEILNSDKNLVVSAPTSFGKSLLIEVLIASEKYKNIVVIQPTLALLDETRKKILKYNDKFKTIIRTSQSPSSEKGNIFLLTAERVMEYVQFPSIDLLIVDEFYKLSGERDEERSDILNNATYRIISDFKCKFYFLGPNIDGITEGFAKRYNAEFYKTDFSLVVNKVEDIYESNKILFNEALKGRPKISDTELRENILFEKLASLRNEQNIIYCSNPTRVRELSTKFSQYLISKNLTTTS